MPEISPLVRIYTVRRKSFSPIHSAKLAWEDMYYSRHVIWQLFKRDFSANLRQKIFGNLWVFITPFVGILSFVFLNFAGVLNPGPVNTPYPLFVFIGTSLWALLVTTMSVVANGLVVNSDLIIRTNIPKIGIGLTGLATVVYNYLVGLVVLLCIFAACRFMPSQFIFLYPFACLPIMAMSVGIGLILSVIGIVARDITPITLGFFGLLMYATPVIFSVDQSNRALRMLISINPLTYLIDSPRSIATHGTIASPNGFLISTLFAVFVLALGIHVFYQVQDKIVERL
jgi:lipopolysaccharide transport system permease protein